MASIYDLKIAPLVAEGKRLDEIARALGMRESDVKRLVAQAKSRQFGRSFAAKSSQRQTEADDRYFPLWVKDFTDEEIAEETGKAVATVQGWRNGRGLKPSTRQVQRARETTHLREWAEKQREETEVKLRPLYDQGLSDVQMAQTAGCSTSTVYSWRKRCGLPNNRPVK